MDGCYSFDAFPSDLRATWEADTGCGGQKNGATHHCPADLLSNPNHLRPGHFLAIAMRPASGFISRGRQHQSCMAVRLSKQTS